MSLSHPDVKSYSEIKQELLDAGFTEEWIEQNYPSQASSPLLEQMAKLLQQQGAGIPQMNYTNLTGFLDNYIQNNSGQQYNQLRTYLSNQGYDDAAIDNILKTAYGYDPNLLSSITGSLFDGLPGGIPDPRAGIGIQGIQFLSGAFGKFFGPQGSIRNFAKNQKAFKASKPERTRYEVDIDPNDPNEYIFDPYDAAEGKLSTKSQYENRLNEFSQFEYNPATGQYDAYYSPRPLDEDTPGRTISQIREGLSDRELQAFEGLNIMPEGSSFDITDGATIYYEPGEDERSQQEIDAATINILERSNPKTSSDPSTIYFDPVYGRPNNSTPITSPPINPNEPIITIDRLGGPVYQKGGGLPMAQKGNKGKKSTTVLFPEEKWVPTGYNMPETLEGTDRGTYVDVAGESMFLPYFMNTNTAGEQVIDYDGDYTIYPEIPIYAYRDRDYGVNTGLFGLNKNKQGQFTVNAEEGPSTQQALIDQINASNMTDAQKRRAIRRVNKGRYIEIDSYGDNKVVGPDQQDLDLYQAGYLPSTPVFDKDNIYFDDPGLSPYDIKVNEAYDRRMNPTDYMTNLDKFNAAYTDNPLLRTFTGFAPVIGEAEDANAFIDAVDRGAYGEAAVAAGFALLPGLSFGSFKNVGKLFRSKPRGSNIQMPRIDFKTRLENKDFLDNWNKFVQSGYLTDKNRIDLKRQEFFKDYDVPMAQSIHEKGRLRDTYDWAYNDAIRRETSPAAKQRLLNQGFSSDQADQIMIARHNLLVDAPEVHPTRIQNLDGVMATGSNITGVHQKYLDDDYMFEYTYPSGKTEMVTHPIFGENIARRRQNSNLLGTIMHETSHRSDMGDMLITPVDRKMIDNALYPNATNRLPYLSDKGEVRARINVLRSYLHNNPRLKFKQLRQPDNPYMTPFYFRRRFLEPGLYEQYRDLQNIMPDDQIYFLFKNLSEAEPQQDMDALPMAQFGIPYAPFEEGLTYELPEELQPIGPQAFSTPDMGYDQPQITEGKKQFGDRFLNFLQSPTAGLMGDIGSTAVGFARFMNPIFNDINAKRQEEELERFGMADNITPLDFSEFPTKGIQSTRSNLLGPESARYTYLNYGRRGTEINDSREVEVDEETLLQLKKLGAEIEIL